MVEAQGAASFASMHHGVVFEDFTPEACGQLYTQPCGNLESILLAVNIMLMMTMAMPCAAVLFAVLVYGMQRCFVCNLGHRFQWLSGDDRVCGLVPSYIRPTL